MNFVECFGFKVYSDNLQKISLTTLRVQTLNTISPNSYGLSTKDIIFKEALKNSDYLVLDGAYFALASIILKRKKIKINPGPDVFKYFIRKMNEERGKVFFLGSDKRTLEKLISRLSKEFPEVNAGCFSPPFKNDFLQDENDEMVNEINTFEPDVLFVGMTCPKQEKWVDQNKSKLKVKLVCSVGAVFDWYAGNQKEISPLWWKLKLAWLKRTIDRPEILKRYPNIGIFFWHLFLATIGIRKY